MTTIRSYVLVLLALATFAASAAGAPSILLGSRQPQRWGGASGNSTGAVVVDRLTSVTTASEFSWTGTIDPLTEPETVIAFPLAEPVDLSLVRRVVAETMRISFFHPENISGEVQFGLTSNGDLLAEGLATFWGPFFDADFYTIAVVDITPEVLSGAPSTVVDGVQLRITLAGSSTQSGSLEVASVRTDGVLETHFVPCEFAPCGPHRKVDISGAPLSFTCSGVCPWQPPSSDSRSAVVADFDNSGLPDLFIGNFSTVLPDAVYLSAGNGQAQFGAGLAPDAEVRTHDLSTGDVDGDGDLDVALTRFIGSVLLFLNDGNGRFEESLGAFGTANQAAEDIELADLDLDGDLDAFVVGDPSAPKVWLGDGGGAFTELIGALPSDVRRLLDVELGDVDGDGDIDALCANSSTVATQNSLYINDGAAQFTDLTELMPTDTVRCGSVELLDVDGDLDLDAYFSSFSGHLLWLNDGSGAFSDASGNLPAAGAGDALGTDSGDVDGDGDLDLVVARPQTNLLLNDGAGLFADATTQLPVEADTTRDVVLEDFDGDSDLDLFLANFNANALWLNDGAGAFTTAPFALPEADDYYRLTEALPGLDLALVTAAPWLSSQASATTPNIELRLSDGTYLRLDDFKSPSDDEAPSGPSVVSSFILELSSTQRASIADLWIVGWRWRLNSVPGSSGNVSVGSLTFPAELVFYYDDAGCATSSAPTISQLEPSGGSLVPAPQQLVLSGVLGLSSGGTSDGIVTLNGSPVDVVDAAGRFFVEVAVEEGENLYLLSGLQSGCGEGSELYQLTGQAAEDLLLSDFGNVSTSVQPQYFNTTFNEYLGQLIFTLVPCNVGAVPLPEGVRLVVTGTPDPSIYLVAPDGYTAGGEPFVWFDELDGDGVFDVTECGEARTVAFANPLGLPFDFDARWETPTSQPPYFTTLPVVDAFADSPYEYAAAAIDPNGHTLEYKLALSPDGMIADSATGQISWSPTTLDVGLYEVEVRASDPFGLTAAQKFTLRVGGPDQNQAPFFTTLPPTQAGVGAPYVYDAEATDPNGSAVEYSLAGPTGMTVDAATGLVEWDFPLNGLFPVSLVATDPLGATATQEFSVAAGVLSPNPTIPTLFGSPAGVAVVGEEYLYQPIVGNLDADELATFGLGAESPSSMVIDVATGRISWIPTAGEVGSNAASLTVNDGNGGKTGQSWTVEVFDELPNRPPVILSTPTLVTTEGEPYTYQVVASDPEDALIGYLLEAAPAGMWIELATGIVTWDNPTLGTWQVAVRATDPGGLVGAQVYDLEVGPVNDPPTITSRPPAARGVTGGLYEYQLVADDPNDQELKWSFDEAPSGMYIHPQTGFLSWVPASVQSGLSAVTVRVDDGVGGSDTQSFDVDVVLDTVPPTVSLEVGPTQVIPGGQVQACVAAADDVAVALVLLTIDGAPIQLDPGNCAIVNLDTPGLAIFRAEVLDGGGNLVSDEVTVSVDPDPQAPFVDPASIDPPLESVITAPTDIRATIIDLDDPTTVTWEVRIRRNGDEDFTVIGFGTGNVTDAVVAQFDPTLLPNDTYDVQIEANDGAQTGGVQYRYSVAGRLKLGRLVYDVLDLSIFLNGIPLRLGRRYDGINLFPGDFGSGWSLTLPGRVVDAAEEADPDATGLAAQFAAEAFTFGTRVYVTTESGDRIGFSFEPIPLGVGLLFSPRFRPDDGVDGSLEAAGPSVVWGIGGRFFDFILPYNPNQYTYSDKNGLEFTIDEHEGLERIYGVNGEVLVVDSNGIEATGGERVDFVRDPSGRITSVEVPDGESGFARIDYSYDVYGRLSAVQDSGAPTSRWSYEYDASSSRLTRVVDADGVVVVEAGYEPSGRSTQLCVSPSPSVQAVCTSTSTDLATLSETLVQPDGSVLQLFFDQSGNVTEERVTLSTGQVLSTSRTFVQGRLQSETLPDGATSFRTYEDDHLVELIGFEGDVTAWEYGPCDKPILQVDPDGSATVFVYDDACRLVEEQFSDGSVLLRSYDDGGVLESFTDRTGATWTIAHGPYGVTSIGNPWGGMRSYEYDSLGRMVTQTSETGEVVEYIYDEAGRIIRERWNGDPLTDVVFQYTPGGKLLSASNSQLTFTRAYFATGQLREEHWTGIGLPSGLRWSADDPSGGAELDAFGRTLVASDDFGFVDRVQFDGLGRVVRHEVFDNSTASVLLGVAESEFNLEQGPDEVRFLDESGATTSSLLVQYACGCSDRISSLSIVQDPEGAATSVLSEQMTYDVLGRRTSTAIAGDVAAADRDAAGRVIGLSHTDPAYLDESFDFDAGGLLTSSTVGGGLTYQSFASGGRLPLTDEVNSYEFDAAGRLTRIESLLTGDRIDLGRDPRGQVVSAQRSDAFGAVLEDLEFVRDGFARLIGIRSSVDGERWFAYRSKTRFLELDGLGQLTRRSILEPGLDGFAGELSATGELLWHVRDNFVDLIAELDSSGSVISSPRWSLYGERIDGGPDPVTDLGWRGATVLLEGTLVDMRGRVYVPPLLGFGSPDPFFPLRFEYANWDPWTFTDPLGLAALLSYKNLACVQIFNVGVMVSGWSTASLGVATNVLALFAGFVPGPEGMILQDLLVVVAQTLLADSLVGISAGQSLMEFGASCAAIK